MDKVTLYTAQRQIVLDTIERYGVYYVKREYIKAKYGESAWVFAEAYAFFRQMAPGYLPCPPEAESGIWLYHDPRWTYATPDTSLIELSIPRDKVLFFDLRLWNRILNLEYIGADERDEREFAERLKRLGLSDTRKLFTTAFYPLEKRRVRESWNRLFSSGGCEPIYLQAASWELRREWIADIKTAQ